MGLSVITIQQQLMTDDRILWSTGIFYELTGVLMVYCRILLPYRRIFYELTGVLHDLTGALYGEFFDLLAYLWSTAVFNDQAGAYSMNLWRIIWYTGGYPMNLLAYNMTLLAHSMSYWPTCLVHEKASTIRKLSIPPPPSLAPSALVFM